MKKVLILEDEVNIRSFVVINLKRAGYDAIEAGTGMEALEKLPQLYSELEQITADMKKDGAEAYIAYMHWGNEFQLQQTTTQQEIAQKLCDLGYDAIIGGHPHVIQPTAVLQSADGHKAFCIYSTGNLSVYKCSKSFIVDSSVTEWSYKGCSAA